MRDRFPLIPGWGTLQYEYVLTNNLLGGTVTEASIAEVAMDTFKAMQAHGEVRPDVHFKACSGFMINFKH